MSKIDPADEAQLFATIDRWVEREVRPRVKEFDHADRWPAEIVEQMKELGLFGATVSPDYGGLGLPAATYAEIVMRISSVWMAITGIFNSHLMLALAIEKFGTEPQKRHWLPRLASGEVRGGLALTEPDAGTDLQGIRMTARRQGDHYVINGTKTWISNGIEGSCFALLVKTNPEAQPREIREERRPDAGCNEEHELPRVHRRTAARQLGHARCPAQVVVERQDRVAHRTILHARESRGAAHQRTVAPA